MRPRPDYQRIYGAGVELVDRVKGLEWSGQILRIEPATDGHHGRMDVLHMQRQVTLLPVVVIGIVFDLVVPKRALALEMLF